jgi:hypothetical protein
MQIFQQAALRPVARMIAALVFFGAARVRRVFGLSGHRKVLTSDTEGVH